MQAKIALKEDVNEWKGKYPFSKYYLFVERYCSTILAEWVISTYEEWMRWGHLSTFFVSGTITSEATFLISFTMLATFPSSNILSTEAISLLLIWLLGYNLLIIKFYSPLSHLLLLNKEGKPFFLFYAPSTNSNGVFCCCCGLKSWNKVVNTCSDVAVELSLFCCFVFCNTAYSNLLLLVVEQYYSIRHFNYYKGDDLFWHCFI